MKYIKINTRVTHIAYPTIYLSLISFGIWLSMFFLRFYYGIPFYITTVCSTLATYVAFTPLHDAIHGSISKNKIINSIPAYLASIQYFYSPYSIFKILHLLHHRYTNDPIKDPDFYSTSRYSLLLPIKWITHIYHYFFHFYTIRHQYRRELIILIMWYCGFVFPIIYSMNFWDLLVLWLLPAHIAITFMVCVFDYIPHKPHKITRKQNIYKCTNVIKCVFDDDITIKMIPHENLLLSILTLNQSYHSIHHLYPQLPFYKYRYIWKTHGDEFKKRGVEGVPIVVKPNIEIPCISLT